MDRSVSSPRNRSVVGVHGPGVSVFGSPLFKSFQFPGFPNLALGRVFHSEFLLLLGLGLSVVLASMVLFELPFAFRICSLDFLLISAEFLFLSRYFFS